MKQWQIKIDSDYKFSFYYSELQDISLGLPPLSTYHNFYIYSEMYLYKYLFKTKKALSSFIFYENTLVITSYILDDMSST